MKKFSKVRCYSVHDRKYYVHWHFFGKTTMCSILLLSKNKGDLAIPVGCGFTKWNPMDKYNIHVAMRESARNTFDKGVPGYEGTIPDAEHKSLFAAIRKDLFRMQGEYRVKQMERAASNEVASFKKDVERMVGTPS